MGRVADGDEDDDADDDGFSGTMHMLCLLTTRQPVSASAEKTILQVQQWLEAKAHSSCRGLTQVQHRHDVAPNAADEMLP